MIKLLLLSLLISTLSFANKAEILDVKILKQSDTYSFSVKILHEDSGWEHYVNRYEVLDKDGNVIATRTLWHPHENEQPFTRSLRGVQIKGINIVYLRANDSVDGYSELYEVRLP